MGGFFIYMATLGHQSLKALLDVLPAKKRTTFGLPFEMGLERLDRRSHIYT